MAKPNDLRALIDLTKTTQTLLTHYQSSLAPAANPPISADLNTNAAELPNPLDVTTACTTLLKSHTTTLSLLLLTPPLTPSAIITKIGDVSSGVLSGLVAAAVSTPQQGKEDELGLLMRAELRAQVRRLIGTWGEALAIVLRFAERRLSEGNGNGSAKDKGKGKDEGPTEAEKQDVLAATGVVWEACDALLKLCANGIAGLVVKKAEEWRSVLLDAVEELKEWGEDVEDEDEDKPGGSDGVFDEEDEIFGAANKLGKDDKELKALLDTSVKKLKMVGMLYLALVKRRLKTFPTPTKASTSSTATNGETAEALGEPMLRLDQLMAILKSIPEAADDLASSFYDLDEEEAKKGLDKCGVEAKRAVEVVRKNWKGEEDEFTAWGMKWVDAFDAA